MTKEYKLVSVEPYDYPKVIEPFFLAMNFSDHEVHQHILKTIELFTKKNRFKAVAIIDSLANKFIAYGSLISLDDRAWIPYVGVDPLYQKQGLGKRLMDQLILLGDDFHHKSLELSATKAGYPLYKKCNFSTDYQVTWYEIKGLISENNEELEVVNSFPNWVYQLDKKVVGEDRKVFFETHNYDKIKIIVDPEKKGFGTLYGNRIGPIIAKTADLAINIIQTAFHHGAKSCLLVEDTIEKYQVQEAFILEPAPIGSVTKMTFGEKLNQKREYLFGFRSFAYG